MSGQEGPLSLLAFMLPSAGWHLPNFMSPSQLYNKERIWAAMQPALGGRENERVGGGGREVGREGLVSSPASTSSETIPDTTLGGSCARAAADPSVPTSESERERESVSGKKFHNNGGSRDSGGGGSMDWGGGGSRVSETGVQGEFSCCFSGSVSLNLHACVTLVTLFPISFPSPCTRVCAASLLVPTLSHAVLFIFYFFPFLLLFLHTQPPFSSQHVFFTPSVLLASLLPTHNSAPVTPLSLSRSLPLAPPPPQPLLSLPLFSHLCPSLPSPALFVPLDPLHTRKPNIGCKSHWEAEVDMIYMPGAYPRILRDNLRVFRQRHWFYNAEDWQ
jgi:hypothetical protein